MKSAVNVKYGPPEKVIQIVDVEKPIPKENEILVKVYVSTVNRTDSGFLRAKPFIVRFASGLAKPKNIILGNEFAGMIEAIGKDVKSFKVGDRVFGYSEPDFGAHAEYMVIREAGMVATIPENIIYEQAAPGTEGAHYALNGIRKANVRSGQKVLVYGATGAIGSAAVQLAKYYGAHVTATCSTKNVDLLKSIGADRVIDYTKEDFTKSGNDYDFILDSVGKTSFGVCKKLLRPGGIYSSTELGFMSQNPFLGIVTYLFGRLPSGKKVLFPIPRETKEDALFIRMLLETGKFKPVIDRKYSLEQIVEAYKYVETGQKVGNVLIVN